MQCLCKRFVVPKSRLLNCNNNCNRSGVHLLSFQSSNKQLNLKRQSRIIHYDYFSFFCICLLRMPIPLCQWYVGLIKSPGLMWAVGWKYWIGNSWIVQISWGEHTRLLLTWMMWVWVPKSMLLFNNVTQWLVEWETMVRNLNPIYDCTICNFFSSFLLLGHRSCGAPPTSWFLHNREILYLSPEYCSVPCHGPHEDCGGHAVRPARAKKLANWVQHSSQVGKGDFISLMTFKL